MNPSILAHRQKIDNLFEKVACFEEPAIKSEWSKYLCILVSGFIEESLRVLLEKYCENKASANIKKFVRNKIDKITNCNTGKIQGILLEFSSNWVCCSVPMSGEIGATCVFDMFVAVQSGTVLD